MKRTALTIAALGIVWLVADRALAAKGAKAYPLPAHVAANYAVYNSDFHGTKLYHEAKYRHGKRHWHRGYHGHYKYRHHPRHYWHHGPAFRYPYVPYVRHYYYPSPYYYPAPGITYYGRGFSVGIGF